MKITIDLEHPKCGEHIAALVALHNARAGMTNVAQGTPALQIAQHDNPAAGTQYAHSPQEVSQAFGGAAFPNSQPGAPSTVGAAVQQTAPGMLSPQTFSGPGQVAQTFNAPGNVQGGQTMPAAQAGSLAPNGIAVDSEGFPWDARIHSSSKELNKSGEWRQKRNLDKAFLAQVQAEIRANIAAASIPGMQQQQPAAMMQQPQTMTQQPQQMQPLVQQQPVAQPAFTFDQLSLSISDLQGKGMLTLMELQDIVSSVGCNAYHLLQARPELWASVWTRVSHTIQGRSPQS